VFSKRFKYHAPEIRPPEVIARSRTREMVKIWSLDLFKLDASK
jgi:hypothetical protein